MGWESLDEAERSSRHGGLMVELSVDTERVRDGRYLCSQLDLLRFRGIEAALQGGFQLRIIPIEEFLDSAHLEISRFAAALHE